MDAMIKGVEIVPLKQIKDDRGKIMHMLRCDWDIYRKFGEVYFSEVLPEAVKAWKRHKVMTQYLAVPVGAVRLVMYDGRCESSTYEAIQEIEIGVDNYQLVIIPPKVWYGYKGISAMPAIIANCPDMPHDPEEIERMNQSNDKIGYIW